MIADAKASAAVAIWEAKIKLTKDLVNLGSCNVAGWREALSKITGKPVTTVEDPAP